MGGKCFHHYASPAPSVNLAVVDYFDVWHNYFACQLSEDLWDLYNMATFQIISGPENNSIGNSKSTLLVF